VECVVYSVGSSVVEEMLDAVGGLGWDVRGGVANVETGYRPADLAPIVGPEAIPPDWLLLPVVVPLVTPGHRWHVAREAVERGFRSFAAVVDRTANVSPSAVVGDGSFVGVGAIVGARSRLGLLVWVSRGAIVSHHADLADYAALGPGCTVCGHVSVGTGAFVGAGAVVNPKVSVGANAVVGSGSVVRRDVPAHTLVAGNPATVVAEVAGYNDVSVGERVARGA
jgi:sugar O-acyltransferase (sialic acid O-acetyltransferase NeuD family)